MRYGPEKQRPLNLNATGLRDLIKWDLPTAKESPLTVNLSKVVCSFQIFSLIVVNAVTFHTFKVSCLGIRLHCTVLQELVNLAVNPLVVSDDGASHTQSVERLIQKITKVSDIVFSAERREQYVRAQERASDLRGEGKTKADFGKLSNFESQLA